MKASLKLDWWPVGQGLFSSGSIRYEGGAVTWVYDCGTASSDRHLENALLDFEQERINEVSTLIDFAVLSHFDRDHVSGFERLAARHAIRMVLLPYVPLWRRLMIAAEEGVRADEGVFRFFLDPAGYLLNIPGSRIGQIVFVPSARPREDVGEEGPRPEPPDEDDRASRDLKVEFGPKPDEWDEAGDAAFEDPRIRYLAWRGRILLPCWEFMPYNDADLLDRVNPGFVSAAATLAEQLKKPRKGSASAALGKLRTLYDKIFGRSSSRRNQISLFLYSGPIGEIVISDFHPSRRRLHSRVALLSPGDGLLNTPDRLRAMIDFYGAHHRIAKIAIFQVMHHGSESSWHQGVAERLCPVVSVICSEPTDRRYGHPHAPVLRDFWPYNAVQVDSSERLQLGFTIRIF